MLDNPRILTILVTMETNKSTRKIWEKIPQIFGWQIVMGCNHEMPTQLKAREVTLRFFQDLLVFASPFATCATISLCQHSHLIRHSVGLNEQKVIPKTMTSSVALPQFGNVPCKRFARNWPGRASVEQMPQQPRKTRYVEVWQMYPIYPPKIMRISRPGKWRQMFLSKFWLVPIPCWIQGWKVVSPAKVDFRFWRRKLQTLKIPDVFQRDTSVALQTSQHIMVSCCFQPPPEWCFLSPPGGWVTIFSSLLHCNPRGSRLEPQQGVRIKEQKSTCHDI